MVCAQKVYISCMSSKSIVFPRVHQSLNEVFILFSDFEESRDAELCILSLSRDKSWVTRAVVRQKLLFKGCVLLQGGVPEHHGHDWAVPKAAGATFRLLWGSTRFPINVAVLQQMLSSCPKCVLLHVIMNL